ncbi:hypothetical protein L1987_03102 [Smallanthus sonchifolius]|uniref:Uncharacterized protein n=1 Tax=Smallanthus sonchifolius TaxID=185202 RepID=A0ACB9K9N5_9ASTR|nr:hypothetical protein L1987_03102 [Smallanthus sonchifolius]
MVGGLKSDFLLLLVVSLWVITLSTFFYLLTRRYSAVKTPCPQSYPLIGNLIAFLRNRHRLHDWLTDMLTTTPSLTLQLNGFLGLSHGICTADPTNLEHLLLSNFHNYIKGSRYTSVLQELLGTGIINSDGRIRLSQRQFANDIFNKESMRTFFSDTVKSQLSKSLIPHLSSAGDTIDLQQVLRTFSFDNICNVAFGFDPCLLTSNSNNFRHISFFQAFDAAMQHASSRFMSPLPVVWKLKRFFNIGNERKYKKAVTTVNKFVTDLIKSKETRNDNKISPDLLSRFVALSLDLGYHDKIEERRKFARDMIITFIVAGKDSTATALTWFFWLLDGHPPCKHLIRKEFSMLMTSCHHTHPLNLTFDDLNNLNYLHAAVSEAMRLFPPIPINSKLAINDDILPDGTYVEKGWFVDYSAYAMGRMESVWGSDCREFKPERWLDGNGVYQRSPLYPFDYPVFNGGGMTCVGREMAYFQMKLVVVAVMHEFEIEVVGGGGTPEKMVDPPYSVSVFLSMRNGLPVRVKKRQQSNGSRGKDGRVIITLFGLFLVGLSFYKHKQRST